MKRFASICFGFLLAGAQPAVAAGPELSAASMTVSPDEPWLIYGTQLDAPNLAIFVAGVAAEEFDVEGSLRRHLAEKVVLPDRPPADAVRVAVIQADAFTAAMEPPGLKPDKHPPALVWARSAEHVSRPLVLNRPEVWTIMPREAAPGEAVRLLGPNMGNLICLLDADGTIHRCDWAKSYSLEKTYTPLYERTLRIPPDVAKGPCRVYVNNGAGDVGWSEPASLILVAPPQPAPVLHAEAPADGSADAAPAIQQAIDTLAAKNNAGVVFLKAGLYRLGKGLVLKPGVTLRGAGPRATTLLPPYHSPIQPEGERGKRALVLMSERSALEFLSLDATDAEPGIALWIGGGSGIVVRNCEVTALRPIDRPEGKWADSESVLSLQGDSQNLVLHDNIFRGPICFGNSAGGVLGAWIAHNVFEGLPTDNMTVRFWDIRESLVEHNVIRHGGRGLIIQFEAARNAFLHNRIENIHGTTNGCESFLYETRGVHWHGAPADVTRDSFTAPGEKWEKPAFVNDATGVAQRAYAVVTAGPGMGQAIPVRELAGDTVRLARPWQLPPDAASKVAVMTGCIENLHVENQILHGRAYSGIFGAGLRNIWAGDELDDMADGLLLWTISEGGGQMSLNLVRNVRFSNGSGLKFIAGCEGQDDSPLVHAFGNEIRACQFYDIRRVPGNTYGPNNRPWRFPFNQTSAGNAGCPLYGWEAAMHFSVLRAWAGAYDDDDPKLDDQPPRIRWTLLWDNLAYDAPVGLRIGRAIENTIVDGQVTVNARRPVWDSGRGTLTRSLEVRTGP